MSNPWLQWWTDNVSLLQQPTYPRLLTALILGSVIGAERQWRQRSAGMRTNTLVCFGAAAFVDLGLTVGGPSNTNVMAYVVSGVGFLGAGAIMKDGGSIRGLNTAATMWCSAAVGACAGAGEMLDAVFMTALLLIINIALRPVSRYLDKRSARVVSRLGTYRLTVVCLRAEAHEVSAQFIRAIAREPLTLRDLRTDETEESEELMMQAVIEGPRREKAMVGKIANELKLSPSVTNVDWSETNLDTE